MTPQPAREFVFRNGLIFGAILGAAQVIGVIVKWLTVMYASANLAHAGVTGANLATDLFIRGSVDALLSIAFFLAMLALTFVAGMSTARKTGKVGLGVFAGLLAGVLGVLIGSLANLVANFTLLAPYVQPSIYSGTNQDQAQGLLISAAIFGLVGGLLLDGGFGAGMGALGGLVGASSYRKANPPAYPAPFYPGAPWQPGAYYPVAPYPGPQYPAPPYPGQAGYPASPQDPQPPQPGG